MAIGQHTTGDIAAYTSTYSTFSGADIVCTFNGTVVGTLAGITWSVTREKAPIYTMGSPNPRSFSRGKRGIAGSLMFTTFDRPALYNLIASNAAKGDTFKIYTRSWNVLPNTGSNQTRGQVAANLPSFDSVGSDIKKVLPYYGDQIPPFDITITYANEYGQAAVKSIYGVELLNEGSGASMDDIVIEETMTYVAREVGPMIPTAQGGFDTVRTGTSAFDTSLYGLTG
jgi:hypothetical protein